MSKRPWILAPWFLPSVSAVLTFGLAALCFWQWQKESGLNNELRQTKDALARAEARANAETTRADAATARQLEALARAEDMTRVWSAERGELERLRRIAAERDALAAAFEEAKARIRLANENINKANIGARASAESITRLTAERDDLARRLNERTEAYNALVKRVEAGER
ncbi:MAG: hypothetical protein ACKO2G_16080 [Verrucomicrobiales bacterium]